jgi:hypothetical protein
MAGAFLFCFISTVAAHATTYYVNNQGRDKNPGTSQSKPWKTIDRVNQQDLNPGDRVLFLGGQTFPGSLQLQSRDTGTLANPLIFSSYGTGTATINSGTAEGVFGYNVNGIAVSNLNFIGGGGNATDGVSFYADVTSGAEGLTISQVNVSKYGKIGVKIGTWGTLSGYRHIHLSASALHHNGENGLSLYAQYPNINQDILLDHLTISYNNRHGIAIGNATNCAVDSCELFENGLSTDTTAGPVAILAYDSTQVMLQHNTAYRTHTMGTDGDGLDFGQNVSFSTMQYNTSHDNDGAGYLLDHGPASGSNTGNIIQNNTSTNDCRKLAYGAIQAWGRVTNATIRANTITTTANPTRSNAGITVANWSIPTNCMSVLTITNNTIATTTVPLVNVTAQQLSCGSGLSFTQNIWQGSPELILWGNQTFSSVVAWTAATGQN